MDAFSVLSGPLNPVSWNVLSAIGEEAISELFSFSLQIIAKRDEIEAAMLGSGVEPLELALLGHAVSFRMGEDGIVRYGLACGVRVEGQVERGGERYATVRVDVAPRAWLLQHRRNSRVFQGQYVHQIVSKVLYESGINHRWNLGHIHPKRIYCIQYDETDFEFVTRLLAEAGILFFFEHAADFPGGAPPTNAAPEESGWQKAASVLGTVAQAAGAAGSILGSEELNMVGAVASVAADFAKPPPLDEEADDPITPGAGSAGPGGAGDVLVFIDQAAFYPEASPADPSTGDSLLTLTLRQDAGLITDPYQISLFTPLERVRSTRVEVRDYDFRRPMLLLQSVSTATAGPLLNGPAPLEIYESHGEYEKPEVNSRTAQLFLEQYRADALTASGRGICPRISPGHTFRIENATAVHLHDDRYAVVRVKHESHVSDPRFATPPSNNDLEALVQGCARAIHEALSESRPHPEEEIRRMIRTALGSPPAPEITYQNRFECVPAGVACRPGRPRRDARNITEAATVVGPIGQEIYIDRYGRIKIQFHWDREGKWKENSSCWVRVIQPWAGAGFGFQFIPRVGMEVLVTFLGGDPDRPVVLGSLYNSTHVTPEPLPQRLTRSGIRTQSSPGGGGFNELSFEDQTGVERVYLHAQKDLHEIVNDTHSLNVKNNQSTTVHAKQQIAVGADQRVAIGGDQSVMVGKNQAAHVQGNRTANVIRNETEMVQGNAFTSVAGVSVRTVKTDELTLIEGDHSLSVHGNSITHIGGRDNGQKSNAVTYVQGNAFLTATDRVLVKAENAGGDGASSSIRLECGDSFIELHHDKITLSARTLEILAVDTAKLKGKDATLTLDENGARLHADPIELQTPQGAELTLDGRTAGLIGPDGAGVRGRTVHLHSGQSEAEQESPESESTSHTPNLKLVFTHLTQDHGGSKIASTRYRLIVEDLVYEGTTNGEGLLQVWVPDTAKAVYVTLWANLRYPEIYPYESGPLHWLVHLVDEIPGATDVKGARIRLRNLGYDPGTDLREDEIDDVTAQALLEFQFDRELPPDGKLEDETKTKLSEIYGS